MRILGLARPADTEHLRTTTGQHLGNSQTNTTRSPGNYSSIPLQVNHTPTPYDTSNSFDILVYSHYITRYNAVQAEFNGFIKI
ncbi:hypothetical protein SDC9_152282 [bioreactor metagenome]|uniref:Uncharacterized protein n=1 Tax=bioreactor metagenome TaxID=1076179 RepID=A0A645EX05_9ZZZZ